MSPESFVGFPGLGCSGDLRHWQVSGAGRAEPCSTLLTPLQRLEPAPCNTHKRLCSCPQHHSRPPTHSRLCEPLLRQRLQVLALLVRQEVVVHEGARRPRHLLHLAAPQLLRDGRTPQHTQQGSCGQQQSAGGAVHTSGGRARRRCGRGRAQQTAPPLRRLLALTCPSTPNPTVSEVAGTCSGSSPRHPGKRSSSAGSNNHGRPTAPAVGVVQRRKRSAPLGCAAPQTQHPCARAAAWHAQTAGRSQEGGSACRPHMCLRLRQAASQPPPPPAAALPVRLAACGSARALPKANPHRQ